jgi:hypothetical protein
MKFGALLIVNMDCLNVFMGNCTFNPDFVQFSLCLGSEGIGNEVWILEDCSDRAPGTGGK